MWVPWSGRYLCVCLCLTMMGCVMPARPHYKSWAAYYGEAMPEGGLNGFDVLVLDADRHPDFTQAQRQGSKVLAYISIAEIGAYRAYHNRFTTLPNNSLGIEPRWGSSLVDVRNPEWQRYIADVLIPGVLAQGFDGIFLDTLDTALELERKNPALFAGSRAAAINLVQTTRNTMPAAKLLMVNRGFDILPQTAPYIDILLAESILVDARTKPYRLFPPSQHMATVEQIQYVKKNYSSLAVFSLDYLESPDKTLEQTIVCTQRTHGFVAYVARQDLLSLHRSETHCQRNH